MLTANPAPMDTTASLVTATAEQRSARRWPLKLPVSIAYENSAYAPIQAQTSNLSAGGVFLDVDSDLQAGSPLEFVLTLPPEITLTDQIPVRCTARVVRVDRKKDGSTVGVAAAIEQYEFLTGTTESL